MTQLDYMYNVVSTKSLSTELSVLKLVIMVYTSSYNPPSWISWGYQLHICPTLGKYILVFSTLPVPKISESIIYPWPWKTVWKSLLSSPCCPGIPEAQAWWIFSTIFVTLGRMLVWDKILLHRRVVCMPYHCTIHFVDLRKQLWRCSSLSRPPEHTGSVSFVDA